jgi:hypothetical protein
MNWRSIKDDGNPTDGNKSYLVTDGKEVAVSDIFGKTHFKGDGDPKYTFQGWSGDPSTYEDNSCCSGERGLDMVVTHWCPTDEVKLPKTK